jgi:hypothetical protein
MSEITNWSSLSYTTETISLNTKSIHFDTDNMTTIKIHVIIILNNKIGDWIL